MSPTSIKPQFFAGVERELQRRGVRFDQRQLHEYLAGMWPLCLDDLSAVRWADAFLEAARAA